MPDENMTPTVPSEQPAAPAAPSQQDQAAVSSPEPAGAVVKSEKAPEIDLDAIRRQVAEETRERTRRELDSEYGKKVSEARRLAQEENRQRQEQLLSSLADFVPDSQLTTIRGQIAAQHEQRIKSEEFEQVKARLAAYEQATQYSDLARRASTRAERAGYNISDLPPDVRGDSPVGFEERFNDFLAEEVGKLKKQSAKEARRAAEEATRETERRLGVTNVSGSSPGGSGKSDLATLRDRLRDAHERGDSAAIADLGRRIEEAVYR